MKRCAFVFVLLLATLAVQGQTQTTSELSPLPRTLDGKIACSGNISVIGPSPDGTGRALLTITASSGGGGSPGCLGWRVHVDSAFCDATVGGVASTNPSTYTCGVTCLAPGNYLAHFTSWCADSPWAGYCDNSTSIWYQQDVAFVIPERHPSAAATFEPATGVLNDRLKIDYNFGDVGGGEMLLFYDGRFSQSLRLADGTGTCAGGSTGTCYANIGATCTPHEFTVWLRACQSDPWTKSEAVEVVDSSDTNCPIPSDDTNCDPKTDLAPCQNCPKPCVANPINVGSGNVSHTVPLFSVGNTPLPLDFELTYHSLKPAYPGAVSFVPAPGWTHTYNTSLRVADSVLKPNWLVLVTEHGHRYYFAQATASLYLPIKPRGTGHKVTVSGTEYVLTAPDASEKHYDTATGKWLSTRDRWVTR